MSSVKDHLWGVRRSRLVMVCPKLALMHFAHSTDARENKQILHTVAFAAVQSCDDPFKVIAVGMRACCSENEASVRYCPTTNSNCTSLDASGMVQRTQEWNIAMQYMASIAFL